MYIEELVLDGFKSYAVRTVLGPFDRQFNAITGLNGSGKSNVLDGICFVLGITNLSKVRATNLSELVYKQGQAGITKANVTVVFNNMDKSRSPVGFESMDSITVSRQVVIGGRNRYILNGKAAQLQDIYNLFHSVQLNINNPHFLIMQGSITKVINMKPAEILGMIEEAAGTGMYESKKTVALRTLEKKQLKVDEIDRIVKEDIAPQMEKLKAEKAVFLEWSSLVQKADALERLVVSWEYRNVSGKLEGGGGQFDQVQADLERWAGTQRNLHASLGKAEEKAKSDTKSLEKQKAQHEEVEKKLDVELQLTKRKLVEVETNAKEKTNALKTNTGKQLKSKSTEKKMEEKIESTSAQLEKVTRDLGDARQNLDAVESELKTKQQLVADMESGAEGNSHLQSDLVSKKTQVEKLGSELKTISIQEKGITDRLRNLRANATKSAEFERLQEERQNLQNRKSEIEQKMNETGFSPKKFEELCDEIRANERKIGLHVENKGRLNSAVSQRLDVPFDITAFGGPAKIKGMVAKLFVVKPQFEKYMGALETLAGNKLYNVVVDSQETCKRILASDRLKKRITILPLDKIQGKRVTDQQIHEAGRIARDLRGECVPAIDTINFIEEVVSAVDYVMGNSFVCDQSEIGQKVTFNANLPFHAQHKTITVDGDIFDPKGSLTGGSAQNKTASRILESIFALQKSVYELEELQEATSKLTGERQRMITGRDVYEKLAKELHQVVSKIALIDSRVKGTAQSQTVQEIAQLEEELVRLAEKRAELETAKSALVADIAALESELGDFTKNRASKLKELQAALVGLKKQRKTASDSVRSIESQKDQLVIDARSAEEELKSFKEDLSSQASQNTHLEAEIAALEEQAHLLQDQVASLGSKIKEAKITRKSFETAIKAVAEALKTTKEQLDEAEVQVTKLTTLMQALAKDRKEAKQELDRLEREFAWLRADRAAILADDQLINKSKSEMEKNKTKLADMKDEVNIRGKSINKRILPLVERSEKETEELLAKRAALEAEKKQIHEFIAELDDKKGRALSRTWQIVNSNFGAIFRSLLPNVDAKLAPPEGMTALEGLELRVQLGSVWKDSLTELSGGQKSLLALSLVLALLLFKPAPFYILDEVDAALDISHTRNIGKMIKQHFPHSQFIIVSLKDGMFNNANVLYRVRFENGTSVVARTTQQNTVTDAPSIALNDNIAFEDDVQPVRKKATSAPKKKALKKRKAQAEGDSEIEEETDPPGNDASDVDFVEPPIPKTTARTKRKP